MKKLVILFAIFILIKPILPVVEYVVFYEYIKNELCENKKLPEKECNGSCFLTKEISKNIDTEESISHKNNARYTMEYFPLYLQEINSFVALTYFSKQKQINAAYLNLYNFLNKNSIFHPPIQSFFS